MASTNNQQRIVFSTRAVTITPRWPWQANKIREWMAFYMKLPCFQESNPSWKSRRHTCTHNGDKESKCTWGQGMQPYSLPDVHGSRIVPETVKLFTVIQSALHHETAWPPSIVGRLQTRVTGENRRPTICRRDWRQRLCFIQESCGEERYSRLLVGEL